MKTAREIIAGANVEFLPHVPVNPGLKGADAILAALAAEGFSIVETGRDPVQDFARRVIRESVFDGMTLDGADVQEMGVELGLLEPTTYDPDRHGPSDCAEPGDEWFVFSGPLRSTREGKTE